VGLFWSAEEPLCQAEEGTGIADRSTIASIVFSAILIFSLFSEVTSRCLGT
jgi:hypothetical protein